MTTELIKFYIVRCNKCGDYVAPNEIYEIMDEEFSTPEKAYETAKEIYDYKNINGQDFCWKCQREILNEVS